VFCLWNHSDTKKDQKMTVLLFCICHMFCWISSRLLFLLVWIQVLKFAQNTCAVAFIIEIAFSRSDCRGQKIQAQGDVPEALLTILGGREKQYCSRVWKCLDSIWPNSFFFECKKNKNHYIEFSNIVNQLGMSCLTIRIVFYEKINVKYPKQKQVCP